MFPRNKAIFLVEIIMICDYFFNDQMCEMDSFEVCLLVYVWREIEDFSKAPTGVEKKLWVHFSLSENMGKHL